MKRYVDELLMCLHFYDECMCMYLQAHFYHGELGEYMKNRGRNSQGNIICPRDEAMRKVSSVLDTHCID